VEETLSRRSPQIYSDNLSAHERALAMEASGCVEKDFPGEGFGGGYKVVDQGGVISVTMQDPGHRALCPIGV